MNRPTRRAKALLILADLALAGLLAVSLYSLL